MELEENMIDNGIYFLYNGIKLNTKSKETLNSLGLVNGSSILVIDPKYIIGSQRNIHFKSNSGSSIIIKSYYYTTIENLIKKYKEEINFDENDNKKQLLFLYAGDKLKTNSKEKVEAKFKEDSPVILVLGN